MRTFAHQPRTKSALLLFFLTILSCRRFFSPATTVPVPMADVVSTTPMVQLYDVPSPLENTSEPLDEDRNFATDEAVNIQRLRFSIELPEEESPLTTERGIRIDDATERVSVQILGTGLPPAPGMQVLARSGLLNFALSNARNERYRSISPDELQRWFLGTQSRTGTVLRFVSTRDTVQVTRGGLSLSLRTEENGPEKPLLCRTFVALLLGGDPAAARVGCALARTPLRVVLRARGLPSLVFSRREFSTISVPRNTLAVPRVGATPTLVLEDRPSTGSYFNTAELMTLGPEWKAQNTLTITNRLDREAVVFVENVAIGWLAANATQTFSGIHTPPIHVRLRSLDGLARSHTHELLQLSSVDLYDATAP